MSGLGLKDFGLASMATKEMNRVERKKLTVPSMKAIEKD